MIPVQPSSDSMPLRHGSAVDFRRVESFLHDAGFDDETVCRAVRVSNMAEVGAAIIDPARLEETGMPTVAALIRLWIAVEPRPVSEVEGLIDPATLASLRALDLLRRTVGPDGTEMYTASVLLYPVAGLLIASDRGEAFAGFGAAPLPDVVFPALYHGTLRLLGLLPRNPTGDVLDLCAGSGIGALVMSRHARRAVAADITARAGHFAQFNRLLNRCENVEVVQGDLYDPVSGRTFDTIAAHPPFIPAESATQVYRDGGVTGEVIVRRIVEGLPRYLAAGGTLYMVCAAWDGVDAPFENRVRAWLGASEAEFDIVFAMQRQALATEVAQDLARRGDGSQATDWGRVFAQARLERQVYGALVVQRMAKDEPGRSVTRRTRLSESTDATSAPWLVARARWLEAQGAAGTLNATLLQSRPRVLANARANVLYRPHPGGLAPERAVLHTEHPFGASIQVDPWMLGLIAKFDGERTVEAVHRSGREGGGMPQDFEAEHLAKVVAMGIERGFFDLDLGAAPAPPPA